MGQTDGETDDGHKNIMSPHYGGGGIIIVVVVAIPVVIITFKLFQTNASRFLR